MHDAGMRVLDGMMPDSIDPYASEPKRFVGRTVRFLPVGQCHGVQKVGIVTAQRFTGRTAKGNLPDYALDVRGSSGKVITISLVENRASFD